MVPVAWVCAAFAYHNAYWAKTGAIIDRFGNKQHLFHNAQPNRRPNTKARETIGKTGFFTLDRRKTQPE